MYMYMRLRYGICRLEVLVLTMSKALCKFADIEFYGCVINDGDIGFY